MSVQKYIINKESSNYTIIPNKVIQGLADHLELLGLYLYLLSLPPNWTFHKTQLKETFGMGINKLERCLKMLAQCELIHVVQNRNELGQFSHFELTVYNGDHFKINGLTSKVQPCINNRGTDTRGTDLGSYKRNIEKDKASLLNKDKENTSCPSENDGLKFFDQFWEKYPRKQKKIDSIKIWKRHKLDDIAPIILKDVQTRNEVYWKYKQKEHIPMPSTYLNGQGWTDELIKPAEDKKPVDFERRNGEIKSTVQWFNENH